MTPPEVQHERTFLDQMGDLAIGPVLLRRIFLILTRVHFSDPRHYGVFQKEIGQFVWSPEPAQRTLKIELDFLYSVKDTDKVPCIYVGTSDITYARIAMGNHQGNNDDRSGRNQILQGQAKVIIRHRSGQADEALRLAEQTFAYYNGIRDLILSRMKLAAFDVEAMLATKPFLRAPDQADQQFIVDVVMKANFNSTWTTYSESHRIKTFGFGEAIKCFDTTLSSSA